VEPEGVSITLGCPGLIARGPALPLRCRACERVERFAPDKADRLHSEEVRAQDRPAGKIASSSVVESARVMRGEGRQIADGRPGRSPVLKGRGGTGGAEQQSE